MMEKSSNGILTYIILLLALGCSPFQSSKVVFTKGPDAPPSGSLPPVAPPNNITPPAGCNNPVTVRLIYSPTTTGLTVDSCQQFLLQNGTYVMGPAISCTGDISSQTSAINFSAINHSCTGNINLAQQGSLSLSCSGNTYDRYLGDYVFRTSSTSSTPSSSNGLTVLGQLCQKGTTNTAPTITNPGNQTNLEGDNVSLQITAFDPNGNSITYQAVGLPTGLSINSATGLISGKIASGAGTASPYSVVLTVTGTLLGAPTVTTFIWNVTNPNLIPAFALSITTNANGATVTTSGPVQGIRYSYDTSGGWITLPGPFNNPYSINKVWPNGTTFACAQAQGTDGVWNGPSTTNTQICNSVTTAATTRSVTLNWNAVTTNSDGSSITNLAGYIMYYTDVSGDWSRNSPIIVNAPSTTGQIANLTIGKTYYFAVSAFNTSSQESPKSVVVTYTP